MEKVSEVAQATYDALMRDQMLFFGLTVLILVFVLYVYFFPKSMDFFTNPPETKNSFQETGLRDKRLRSEPSENDPHAHHTPIHEAP